MYTAFEEICVSFIEAERDNLLEVGVCYKPLANQ